MKHKTKPIKDLYFRFIQGTEFDGVLNAQQAAHALETAGLITYVPHNSKPSIEHYRDTDLLIRLVDAEHAEPIHNFFRRYILDHGLGDL